MQFNDNIAAMLGNIKMLLPTQSNGRRWKKQRRAQRVALAVKEDFQNVSNVLPDHQVRDVIEFCRLAVEDD